MAAKPEKRLFIIDGTALAYRAYFALIQRPLVNSKGLNTSAVFGFTQSLLKILDEEKPDYLAVAFDSKEPTFRHQRYDQYKATREKMPDDMVDQLPYIERLVTLMGIPFLAIPEVEADDIIGTLVKKAESEGITSFIVSGDKDFMQLVNHKTFLYTPAKGSKEKQLVGTKEVEEKLGVPPNRVVDYLGLVGDSSDNVPGVAGIGPKTAKQLIHDFGSVEELLKKAAAGEVQNKKLSEKLLNNQDSALLSKELILLKTDVNVGNGRFTIENLKPAAWDHQALADLFRELEFQSLETRVRSVGLSSDSKPAAKAKASKTSYTLVDTCKQLDALIKELRQAGSFAFDTETTSLNFFTADLVGIAFATEAGRAWYVNLRDHPEWLEEPLKDLLEDTTLKKGGHNIKYDLLVLKQHGVEISEVAFDSMIESYLLDASLRRHKLDLLAMRYLNHQMIPIESLIGKGKAQITMDQVDPKEVSTYACEDADMALRLHQLFYKKISHQELEKMCNEVEIPLISVLKEMEFNGIHLDTKTLQKLSKKMESRLLALTKEIYDLAGEEFNIQSTKQLGPILFDKLKLHKEMGLKRIKKTKTGYSTDVSVLESLLPHPLAKALIEYRNVAKLKSTYVDALPELINQKRNTVHTSFNQTVAATGRLSSSDPNLQNIPIRSDLGRSIREAFIPPDKDHLLLSADYSQIELRLVAHMSGDENLIQAFVEDKDIHTQTACRIFKVPADKVDNNLRSRAKAINFGLLYGMGPKRLADETGVTMEEAEQFIRSYFAAFPKVEKFVEETLEFAREHGFCKTMLNRQRPVTEINSGNPRLKAEAERIAVNTPIQGSAADLIKLAMINLHHELKERQLESKLLLQVHDELLLQVKKPELEEIKKLVVQCMQEAMTLDVPLKVEVGTGANWLSAHP